MLSSPSAVALTSASAATHELMPSQAQQLAQPPLAAEALAFYRRQLPSWIGGYTVEGTSIMQGRHPMIEHFEVAQECLCTVDATPHGIYAQGANADNAFSLVAAVELDGQWVAQQASVGAIIPYVATMRFGPVAGGVHSAVGFQIRTSDQAPQVVFRAEQSGIGCHNGVGALACEDVCAAQGLPWAQIQAKCSTAPQYSLNGSVLTDWNSPWAHEPAAALFSTAGSRITLQASLDGKSFYALRGHWLPSSAAASSSGALVVDFTPLGGPRDLPGDWYGDRIEWSDGNVWRHDAPACAEAALQARQPVPSCWPASWAHVRL